MGRYRTTTAAAVLAALLAVLTACSAAPAPVDDPPPPPANSAAPASEPTPVSLAESQQSTEGPVAGYAVTIPKLGASSSLIGLGLNADRSIQVPPLATPEQAGVYTRGPMPGETGPAVVLAHVDARGVPGFGAGFHTLAPGDTVEVTTPGGPVTFAVTRTTTVPKAEFPTAEVYSDTAGPELRLITCGGTLDRDARNYLGQTIVYAQRV